MDLLKGMRIKVRAHISETGKGLTYPSFSGVLLDDANSSEGWDVVDVMPNKGKQWMVSIYCFSIERVEES